MHFDFIPAILQVTSVPHVLILFGAFSSPFSRLGSSRTELVLSNPHVSWFICICFWRLSVNVCVCVWEIVFRKLVPWFNRGVFALNTCSCAGRAGVRRSKKKKKNTDSCCEELTGAETQHGGTQPHRKPGTSFLAWLFHNCPASSWGRLGQFNIVKSPDVTRPPLRMWSYSTERNSVIAWGWNIEGPQIRVPVYFV